MKHFFVFVFLIFGLLLISPRAYAADIKAGEEITLPPSAQLINPYVFGKDISSDASVSGDLILFGGNIKSSGTTKGSVMGAGGDMVIEGITENSIRVAGGNITIKGDVARDVVVAGGTVIIDTTASIGGDLIFAGGTLQVNGPVKGRLFMRGGSVTLASTIGGSVEGEVGALQIKDRSEIAGDLTYTSSQRALIADSAIIRGEQTYHPSPKKETNQGLEGILATGILLKLITDILFCLLLIYLIPGALKRMFKVSSAQPLKTGFIGLVALLLIPLIATVSLVIIWLGISIWLLYFLLIILSLMVSKVLLGWFVLVWWGKRKKTEYSLDWRAGIVGPLLLGTLLLIPVVGWITAATVYLIAFGTLILGLIDLRRIKNT